MIPKIGDVITNEKAIGLCRTYGFEVLANRIEDNPTAFKNWVFDGASMIPDELFRQIFGIPNLIEIALRHDLKYAYGEPHNKGEKAQADTEFQAELLKDGASPAIAKLMYEAVVAFGDGPIETSFTWGFARL